MHLFRTLQPVRKIKDLRHDEETLRGCWDHTAHVRENRNHPTLRLKVSQTIIKHDKLHKGYNPAFDALKR